MVILHADTVTENRSAGVWTRRIDCNDAYGLILFAIVLGKLIDQRAFARSRRAGYAEDSRLAGMREESFKKISPARCAILHDRNRASQGAHVASAERCNQRL